MPKKKKLEGLGGWLIFPVIGLFGSLLLLAYDILLLFANYELTGLVLFAVLIDLVVLALVIGCMVLTFMKKKLAPKLFITVYIVNVGVAILLLAMVGDSRSILRAGLIAAIWIPYFLNSKRVKNTFVR
jgi:hypothetical protein